MDVNGIKIVMLKMKVLKFMVILLTFAVIFPPHIERIEGIVVERKWGFLFSSPLSNNSFPMVIDIATLFVEFILIGLLSGLLYLYLKGKEFRDVNNSK